jgi:hypothetical protein
LPGLPKSQKLKSSTFWSVEISVIRGKVLVSDSARCR